MFKTLKEVTKLLSVRWFDLRFNIGITNDKKWNVSRIKINQQCSFSTAIILGFSVTRKIRSNFSFVSFSICWEWINFRAISISFIEFGRDLNTFSQSLTITSYAFIHWITQHLHLGEVTDEWNRQLRLRNISSIAFERRRLRCECEKCRKLTNGREKEWLRENWFIGNDCGLWVTGIFLFA